VGVAAVAGSLVNAGGTIEICEAPAPLVLAELEKKISVSPLAMFRLQVPVAARVQQAVGAPGPVQLVLLARTVQVVVEILAFCV